MSSLSKLQKEFDKVFIKYTDKSCRVLLTKGLKCFKGFAKCHDDDNFNRKLGREIALGRAEFASKVASGDKVDRASKITKSTGEAKYSFIQHGDINELDECIMSFLPKNSQEN